MHAIVMGSNQSLTTVWVIPESNPTFNFITVYEYDDFSVYDVKSERYCLCTLG